MKSILHSSYLMLIGAALLAQSPGSGNSRTYTSSLGFSYSLPADWEVVDSFAEAQEQARQSASSEDEKKGLQCVQMVLTARHGEPGSVIVEAALPFDCYGQKMTQADLPKVAEGASEGVKRSFDVGEPVVGQYMLGTHDFWIERIAGTPKGQPSLKYTIEIACSPLKKAAVCWMTIAADDAALRAFERGTVSLDGDAPAVLVPPSAFDNKPS